MTEEERQERIREEIEVLREQLQKCRGFRHPDVIAKERIVLQAQIQALTSSL